MPKLESHENGLEASSKTVVRRPSFLSRKRKRTFDHLSAASEAIANVKGLKSDLNADFQNLTIQENWDEFVKKIRRVCSDAAGTFRVKASDKPKDDIMASNALVQFKDLMRNLGNDEVDFLKAFLFVSVCLGFITQEQSKKDDVAFLNVIKQDTFWNQTIEGFITFLKESCEATPNAKSFDLVPFIEREIEELYFSSLSRILRTGGHKLKSKLKPENIGLLIPGDFLPSYPRILKNKVALQITEKSNHLYTWKDAGDTVFVKRKKTSWTNLLSRNIRPRNRISFKNEEVFFSAWDTTFYTLKCEEVLENEFYNQLENSMNNHGKRRQLSMKKIEINKRKKANDTKDSFYFNSFLNRSYVYEEATNILDNLRLKAIQEYKDYKADPTCWKVASEIASASSKQKSESTHTTEKSSATKPQPNGNTESKPKNSIGGVGPANNNSQKPQTAKKSDDDGKRPKKPIKQERIGGCASAPVSVKLKIKKEVKPKMEKLNGDTDSVYANDVIGNVRKPKSVLETQDDLMSYVHSKPVDVEKMKEQFDDRSEIQRRKTYKTLTRNGDVSVPQTVEKDFDALLEIAEYVKERDCLPVIAEHIDYGVLNDEDRDEEVGHILSKLVYGVVVATLPSPAPRSPSQSSVENTDDEAYEAIHEEYLNVVPAKEFVDSNSETARPVKRRKSVRYAFK